MSQIMKKNHIKKAKELFIRKNGAVYTPEKLSNYVAHKMLQYALEDTTFEKMKRISIIDPACGDGMLLESISKLLEEKELKQITLCGIDIDLKAIESCKKRLQEESFGRKNTLSLINTNALCPFDRPSLAEGLESICKKAFVKDGFDLFIANPPWGADISKYRDKLDVKKYATLQRQIVDSFELFIEFAMNVVKKDGFFAFIVPDSILNHGKSIIRDKLVTSTEIKFIARLGEKLFHGINRACVLIICKNSSPSENNLVDCFRLPKKYRNMILAGKFSFFEAEKINVHKVQQNRFANNAFKQFDIDLRENETSLLSKLQHDYETLDDALSGTRGVELGISGMICACSKCGIWSPLSKKKYVRCNSCGEKYDTETAKKTSIVTHEKVKNSVPLITGRDLKRYVHTSSKRIILGMDGINYKSKNTFKSPKLLIRKTGVGLTAALDYSSAYTTQVVYIFRSKPKYDIDLKFFISLINSRVYYFILVKSFGELEWRSHPYLTQLQILSLPLPNIKSEKHKKIVDKIISLLQPTLANEKPSKQVDIEIELLIGELFSLTKNDYKIIFNAINESEELLPVRELKNFDLKEILKRLGR